MSKLVLNEARLFPADPSIRAIAIRLYKEIAELSIISPHGHTDPAWFSVNEHFSNAAELLLTPDHYLLRMLYSQGVELADLGICSVNNQSGKIATPREAWRIFAKHFYLFYGTPSAMWLNYVFANIFHITVQLNEQTADHYFDTVGECLRRDEFRPRTLFDAFNIELLATTESSVDTLNHHEIIRQSDWNGNIIPTYRPDPVVDPEHEQFSTALPELGELTGEDTYTWQGYLNAHRERRADFIKTGATASDHGHPTAMTADLSMAQSGKLFNKIISGKFATTDAEMFRGQMLTEMAKMSIDDGLVMQIHPGSFRNHNAQLFQDYGRDMGADIPQRTDYVRALKPLLDRFGNEKNLSIILFTLDETTYSRELAPLAGHYPILKLGPAWWFHDSPEGMLRFRMHTTETAGFYNTVGFNDDTRAFLSIPARHDMARRLDCAFLARYVSEHRIDEDSAHQIALDLTYNLPKRTYRISTTD